MSDKHFNELDSTENEKIRIKLVLSKEYMDHEPSLAVTLDPIAVPASTRRSGLSAIVNHLLDRKISSEKDEYENEENGDKLPSLPFDFIVCQKLLRTSIDAAARREGLGLEHAIEIQYFPALSPPLQQETRVDPEPDWIYSLSYSPIQHTTDPSVDGYLVSGSANGSLRVMQTHPSQSPFSLKTSFQSHSGPVTCVSSINIHGQSDETTLIASGSLDQTLYAHLFTHSQSNVQKCAAFRGGHFASISSVTLTLSTDKSKGWMASGDFDGGLCLWSVPCTFPTVDTAVTNPNRKRAKKSIDPMTDDKTIILQEQDIAPSMSFKAHSNNLSGLVWSHDSTDTSRILITSSWDHSIKSWDVEKQNNVVTLNGSKVVTCLGRCINSDVVATGHPDCTVRLWDMRSAQTSATKRGHVSDNTLLPSHKSWVSCVQWSPSNPFVLASSSHDGTIKLWDIRSSLPLYTIAAHTKGSKSLSLAITHDRIFSGGSDCDVKAFKY